MRKKTFLPIALSGIFLFISVSIFAQNKTVTGTIVDKSGAAIEGASVVVKGSNLGTNTKTGGTFSIVVPPTAKTLVISFVGFAPKEEPITDEPMNVLLESASNNDLNEVVVIGYGTARKKDVTGSVASVTAKDFNKGVILSPDQLLQGKVPGLDITSNSGQPGAATTVKIRGNNSIRANNNPLYVIDGVPLDGRTARPNLKFQNGLDFGTTPEVNPLLYINPNDIAQIDVLKDASATAIYGSRGANGIIVITTKKGSLTGPRLEFGTSLGTYAGFMHKYKVLTAGEFRQLTSENGLDYDSSSSVDALKSVSQSPLIQSYNLGLSGGNNAGKFRASFLASKTPGFMKKTGLDKYIGSFYGQHKFIDNRVSIDFNVIAGHTSEDIGLFSNDAGAGGNIMSYVLNWNPTKSFKTSTGEYSLASNSIPNPLAVIDGFNDVANVNVFLANISASVKIITGLDYKFLYAINHGVGERKTNVDGWIDGVKGVSGAGFAAISNSELTSQTYTHTLSYTTRLTQDIKLDAVGGYEYWKTSYSNSTLSATQFNTNLDSRNRIPVLYTSIFQNAKTQFPLTTNVDPKTEIQSVFGRVNFNMLDKYYLTATLRADGSNKFGSNNRYGYFPSVGVKWMLTNEDFLKDVSMLDNLSLRASWGKTGNQEFPAGASLEQFTSGAYNSIGQSNVANPNLKWETTTSFNVGVDFSLIKRIFGSLDFYHKNTTDLLFQSTAIQPAPASIFFINLPANLINTGVEFAIGADIVSGNNFSWDAGFNIAYNKNKLKNFNQGTILTGKIDGQGVSGTLGQVITNNQPVNEFFLKKFNGFDKDGIQIIDANPTFAGDPNPHVILGFTNTLSYNKLSLSLNASGAFGYVIYNNTFNTITNISNIGKGQNIAASALDTDESITDGVVASSRYLEKGNYFKLRNATLMYAFGSIGNYIKNINVFVSGTNLFVITKFTGFDPEVNVDKNNNNYPSRSIEYIPYPTPRIITFGINLGL